MYVSFPSPLVNKYHTLIKLSSTPPSTPPSTLEVAPHTRRVSSSNTEKRHRPPAGPFTDHV